MYHLSNIASYHYKLSRGPWRYAHIAFHYLLLTFLVFSSSSTLAQNTPITNENIPNNTTSELNKKRLHWSLGIGAATYAGTSAILYNQWYQKTPRSSFHTIDDFGAWRGMDKAGHIFSSYFQSRWAYDVWKWSGMKESTAVYSGLAVGFLAQTTIEVFDGFSADWGFSWTDMGANAIGLGLFAGQQFHWGEQRILVKSSFSPIDYRQRYGSYIAENRAAELYGNGFSSRILKDYNAQTTWLSFNIHSLFNVKGIPKWLNVGIGYGAENLFGAYSNNTFDGMDFSEFPRYSQFFLSLDADLTRVKTNSPFLRTLLDVLNILKMPFSTIEFNTLGEVKFHLIRF